uniref:EEF1A lysine methyltransferase 1 n=1 Tax=Oncorhynchus tshawytscha TaxID=74940 RepID=A0A8C8DGI0_ONCTS
VTATKISLSCLRPPLLPCRSFTGRRETGLCRAQHRWTSTLWGRWKRTGIACLSAPSVYQKLKQGVVEGSDGVSAVVLEYDRRFATYGQEFIFYDYNEPLALPEDVAPQSFDIVLADPPYLSEECLNKVAQTVKYLAKGKVLLCTGAIMEEHAVKLMGLKICSFLPKHNKNLANEFRCFTNYPSNLMS